MELIYISVNIIIMLFTGFLAVRAHNAVRRARTILEEIQQFEHSLIKIATTHKRRRK